MAEEPEEPAEPKEPDDSKKGGGNGGSSGGTGSIVDKDKDKVEEPEPPTAPERNNALNYADHFAYVVGYPDGMVRPESNITRAEVATIFFRLLTDEARSAYWTTENSFNDVYGDGSYRPDTSITRAEVMSMINRVMERVPETTGDLLNDMIQFPDNADTVKWYYIAVQEATNSHDFERKSDGYYETWISLRENRDWSKLERSLRID